MARTELGDPKSRIRVDISSEESESTEYKQKLNRDFENLDKSFTVEGSRAYQGHDYEKAIDRTYRKY